MRSRSRLLLVSLCCLMPRALFAAGPMEYRVNSWNGDTRLPQNAVNRLTQTRDGYLWLPTFAGLVRYDGARFQVFDRGNSPGMRISRFLSLFEDHEGVLWSVTEGRGVTRYRNGSFTSYTAAGGLPDNNALVIFEDQAGRLFVETDQGLAEFRNGGFVPAPVSLPSENTFLGAVKLAGGRHGTAMWYLDSSGLHQRDENGIIRSVPSPPGEPVRSPRLRWCRWQSCFIAAGSRPCAVNRLCNAPSRAS